MTIRVSFDEYQVKVTSQVHNVQKSDIFTWYPFDASRSESIELSLLTTSSRLSIPVHHDGGGRLVPTAAPGGRAGACERVPTGAGVTVPRACWGMSAALVGCPNRRTPRYTHRGNERGYNCRARERERAHLPCCRNECGKRRAVRACRAQERDKVYLRYSGMLRVYLSCSRNE